MLGVFGAQFGEQEIALVKECLEKGWVGMGDETARFERDLAEKLGLPAAVMTNSGTSALTLGVAVLQLPTGTEVILPSFTWVGCAHAIRINGCTPVFCDVELDTMNVSVETVSRQMTDKTSAVMVVHYAGKPVDINPIVDLRLPVIEDAAHAICSTYGGKACGNLGMVGVYSFGPVKNLASCEAGALISDDPELIGRAREFRYCGIAESGFSASAGCRRWWEHRITGVMPKSVPSDVAAAICRGQLNSLEELQRRRLEIWSTYRERLADIDWIRLPVEPSASETHSYFTFCIRVLSGRDRLAHHLRDRGIYTTVRYQPLHQSDFYKTDQSLPNSQTLNREALNIPLHPRMSDADVETVVSEIRSHRA